MKSSVEQIRERFDHDVERFSNLETGQSAIIDAVLLLELVARSAAAVTPHAHHVVDVGCGAGNFSLRLLRYAPHLDCTLIDLSRPMLDRAAERVASATTGKVATIQGDVRAIDLPAGSADIILAGSSLHHLRADAEWASVFAQFASWLRPGGSAWFSDLIDHDIPQIQAIMWARYGDHLTALKDEAYRDHVFDYVKAEDTPRPLFWQLELLRRVGFDQVEVLHKNAVFAAFGGVKSKFSDISSQTSAVS